MTTPALRQVLAALAAQLAGIPGTTIYSDRTGLEPFDKDETPAISIRCSDVQFDTPMGLHTTQHKATIDIDIVERSAAASTIPARLQQRVAQVIAAVHADRTLGGRIQSIEEHQASADGNDTPDVGAIVLMFEATFDTPRGDFNTLLGSSAIFT